MPTGGRLIARCLAAHGVERAFCVPGESYLPLLDGLYEERHAIAVIPCRHEHGAAMMADATGKLTGRPGVCLVTRGPGACNASIGVHTAFQDSTPMLLFIGQVPRPFLGREAFQEVDLVRQFSALAKRTVQLASAAEAPAVVAEAFRTAMSGRPGPVVIALPEDVLEEEAAAAEVPALPAASAEPDPGELERLRRVIADSRRPLAIVGGGGWTDAARRDLLAFLEANALPACCTFRRQDLVDNRNAVFVGELGIAADPALVETVKAADLVLAIGTRLGEITSQGYTLPLSAAAGRGLAHVYPDRREFGRVFQPSLAIEAAMPAFAAAARRLAPVGERRWEAWSGEARRDYERNRTPVRDDAAAVDLGRIVGVLDERLPDDAVITVDAGNFSGWAQRYLTFGGGRRLLGPCNGAMGYGVPAAIAAKLQDPRRAVIACVGDGGFGMTGQELATAVQFGVAIVIVVFNNGLFGTIRLHQERTYPGRPIATELRNPDYAALARACGAAGATVSRTDEFLPALADALRSDGPTVIDLRMDPDVISTRTRLSALRSARAD